MHLSCIQVNYHPENSLSWRLLTWYRRRCLKCAAPLGFACPSGSKAAGRLHCLPQLGFPPLHSHCWRKFQAETMSRSRGMICPQLPPPSRRAAHLLCVASPGGLKETVWEHARWRFLVSVQHRALLTWPLWAFMFHIKQRFFFNILRFFSTILTD